MDKKNQWDKKSDRYKDDYSFDNQKKKANDRRINEKRHKNKRDKFDGWN